MVGVSQRAVGMWEEEARVVSNRSTSNANIPTDNRRKLTDEGIRHQKPIEAPQGPEASEPIG